jgi:F-type H+-transporting ATPase subunit b
MHVNWFTVVAQIINFFALAWLLSRFLYKPILNAIDEREKKIVAQLEEAKAKVNLAEKEKEEFRNKNENFDREKSELFKHVVEESERKRRELLEEARINAGMMKSKLESALIETQKDSNQKIAHRIQQEVFAVSSKALKDIASIGLEEQSVNYFLDRIRNLRGEEKIHFTEALKSKNPVIVRSAFDLEASLRSKVEKTLEEILNTKLAFQFETLPHLICGIELVTDGFKLGWNLSSYFVSLEKSVSESINQSLR